MKAAVVGAGGAIGSAVVRRFAGAGFDVIGIDISERTLEGVSELNCRIACDLLSDEGLARVRDVVDRLGVDCVVTAHGIDGSCPLSELTGEFYEKVLNVNTVSTYRIFRAVMPALARSKGTFTVVVSQAGLKPEANNVAYCASKYALSGWIQSMAEDALEQNVTVRGICPGCIGTPLYYAAQERFARSIHTPVEEYLEMRNRNIPLGRIASVEEIAECIYFLAQKDVHRPVLLAPTGGETFI